MPTIEELSALDPSFLAAALEAAKKRESEERSAKLPKCKCGAVATQAAVAVITYKFAPILTGHSYGGPYLGRFEDEADYCPGEGGPEDAHAWVCCDSETCSTDVWRAVPYNTVQSY